jgi:Xaa-Pro dipeptidase
VYPHQAERLSEALERAHLDAFVATSPENIAYITGFRGLGDVVARVTEFAVFTRAGTALGLPACEVPSIVADAVEVDHVVCFGGLRAASAGSARRESRRLQEIVASAVSGPGEALTAALARLGVRGAVGLDESGLTHEEWERLAAQSTGVGILPASGHLATARRVKGPYEIECLGHALRIAEEALDAVIQAIGRGMTEREAATLFTAEVLQRGGWPRPPLVAIGERSGIPWSWPTDSALRPGDLVRFQVGCVYKGYCASVGRTAALGEPSSAQEALYQAVQAGLESGLAAISPGTPARRAFDALVKAIRANGLGDHDAEDAGHGIGLEPREMPALAPGNETPLEPGEVLCVEAAHCQFGFMGVSVKDTVLVTTVGASALNRSYHGLVVLD